MRVLGVVFEGRVRALTLCLNLQRNYGLCFAMTVGRYHRVGAGEIESGARNLQTVLGSVANAPEVWCVLVVLGLRVRSNELSKLLLCGNKLILIDRCAERPSHGSPGTGRH